MLDLLGGGYVIDYCMSSLLRERERERDEKVLWYYVTDCLRLLTENTAKSAHTEAGYIPTRYADIASPKPREPEKTADEIVADIFRRAGLKTKGEEVTQDGNGCI